MLEERKGEEPKAWLTPTALPRPHIWASDHSTEVNLFCPLPPPCPFVQRLQKSKQFVSPECCPQCPSRGLAISHRAGWTLGSGCASANGRRQGAPIPAHEPLGVLCSLCTFPAPFALPQFICALTCEHFSFPILCVHLTCTVHCVLSPCPFDLSLLSSPSDSSLLAPPLQSLGYSPPLL